MLAEFYRQIQVIMTILGYYDGVCNGVWGPKSIEAMKKWESTDDFEPAIPYNGRPFNGRGSLPAGLHYAGGLNIMCEQLNTDRARELLATPLLTVADIEKQCGVQKAEAPTAAKGEQYVHEAPKTQAPTVIDPVPEPEKPAQAQAEKKTDNQSDRNKKQ